MDVLEFGEGYSKVSVRRVPGGPVAKILPSGAGGARLIPDGGTKIPLAAQCGQNKKVLSERINT